MDFDKFYSSKRSPVFAENIVASSQPLATQAGINILQNGGNAVDAALVTAIVLTVVEPTGNGLGSDAVVLLADEENIIAINGTGCSPSGWTRERFENNTTMPLFGWDSVTIPGAVKMWWRLSERYGRLSFPQLFTSAISYAKKGFLVGNKVALEWKHYYGLIKNPNQAFRQEFLPAPNIGDWLTREKMSCTLEEIAETGYSSFYEGEIALTIIKQSNNEGGVITADDLAAYEPNFVEPIKIRFRDVEIAELPPNTQGLYAIVALGILNYLPIAKLDSTEFFHYQIEAMKLSLEICQNMIADPNFYEFEFRDIFDEELFANQASSICSIAKPPSFSLIDASQDTVYLATADASGLMVSFIQSNYLGFGSGVVVNGKGIALHNRGAGFSLDSSHPNIVGPRKKPFHTIIPGMVFKSGQPLMAFGMMGGPMQPQGHLQLLDRIITHKLNPQAACDAPRWQIIGKGKVIVEPSFPKKIVQELSDLGHDISFEENEILFGGAQVIQKIKGGFVAGSDPRKEGCAAGF
tara:strand:+ start:226 stop:1791 length:1566 start_codon:yes stop_codon:yes gene_type:complete